MLLITPKLLGAFDILLPTAPRTAHVELGMVEQVEELGAELQVGALAESY